MAATRGYCLWWNNTLTELEVRKVTAAGTSSVIGSATGLTQSDGELLRLEATGGATTTLKIFQAGVQRGSDITDASSPFTNGSGGIASQGNNFGDIDNFEGGNLSAPLRCRDVEAGC